MAQWDEFNGRIQAAEIVELRPRVSGHIQQINYVEGAEVRQGDVLFMIDDRSYQAELAQAIAELKRARSQMHLGQTEARRSESLMARKAISTEQHEQRIATATQSQAGFQSAQARVDMARLNLDFTRVRAPISGRVSRAVITAGNVVTANETLLTTLVSQEKMYIYFDMDEPAFLSYQQKTRQNPAESTAIPIQLALTNETGYPHRGVVDFLDNQMNAATGTINTRARVDNSQRYFTHGLYARVRMQSSETIPTRLIDDRAILTDQNRKYVYIVDSNSNAQRRDVLLGRKVDGLRIILDGLTAQDRIVVVGTQKIFFSGMPVQVEEVAMAPSLPVTTNAN